MVAPRAAGIARADLTTLTEPLVVSVTPPVAETTRNATVLASIFPAIVRMTAPRGIGHDGATIIAIGGPIPDIMMSAPEGSPQVIPDAKWEPIQVDYVDGFVEVDEAGFAPLRFKRSHTSGNIPTLEPREIAIHETDGILFTRDGDGNTLGTNFGAFRDDKGFAPEGGTAGNVLVAGGTWSAPAPEYGAPMRLPLPPATRVALSDAVISSTVVVPEVGTVYYRPFYVPQVKLLSKLALEVVDPATATVWMGVCRWDPRARLPGDTLILGSVDISTAGVKQITPGAQLEAGWYAAMLNVTGSTGGSFRASTAQKTLDNNFTLIGDPTALAEGDLNPAPAPSGNAADAWAIVQAETA